MWSLLVIFYFMNANIEQYAKLEKNGVYIHYNPEHYKDGTNMCFSIQFKNHNTQTCWYNDNHEFGDVVDVMGKSIQLALWYLEEPKRIELIDSGYHNPDYIRYLDEIKNFLKTL